MLVFHEILNDLVLEKGLSLKAIERQSGISSSQMSKYLKLTTPSVEVAIRIADYFDCSLDYLFGLTNDKNHAGYTDCDMSKFITRYETALSENNTTHWKFAQKYNVNESLIRRWKSGTVPKFDSLVVIAKHLSVSLDYLVGRK